MHLFRYFNDEIDNCKYMGFIVKNFSEHFTGVVLLEAALKNPRFPLSSFQGNTPEELQRLAGAFIQANMPDELRLTGGVMQATPAQIVEALSIEKLTSRSITLDFSSQYSLHILPVRPNSTIEDIKELFNRGQFRSQYGIEKVETFTMPSSSQAQAVGAPVLPSRGTGTGAGAATDSETKPDQTRKLG